MQQLETRFARIIIWNLGSLGSKLSVRNGNWHQPDYKTTSSLGRCAVIWVPGTRYRRSSLPLSVIHEVHSYLLLHRPDSETPSPDEWIIIWDKASKSVNLLWPTYGSSGMRRDISKNGENTYFRHLTLTPTPPLPISTLSGKIKNLFFCEKKWSTSLKVES